MPFYDYKCTACKHLMENQLKRFDQKVITCKACEQETAQQLFSGKFAAHGLPNGHIAVRTGTRKHT